MQTHLSPEEKKLIGYKAESSLDENYAGHSYVKEILLTLFSNKGACIGLVCILIIVGFAIFAPMVSSYTYKEVHSDTTNLPMRIPGLEKLGIFDGTRKGVDVYASKGVKDQYHYFGTDALGRDIWTRVWEGTRISLLIADLGALKQHLDSGHLSGAGHDRLGQHEPHCARAGAQAEKRRIRAGLPHAGRAGEQHSVQGHPAQHHGTDHHHLHAFRAKRHFL